MQPLRGRRRIVRHASSTQYLAHPESMALPTLDVSLRGESRYEPQTFGRIGVPIDPYTVWLKQREADRERDNPDPVRCVFRPRVGADPVPCGDHEARELVSNASGRPQLV
jgi:hypothetical protein